MKNALILLLFFGFCCANENGNDDFFDLDESGSNLFRDLAIVEKVNNEIHDELPFLFNYTMQGGYFTMPSARVPKTGVAGFGFAYVPPYHIYSLLFQFFDHIELTANYWVFRGVEESTFGCEGFGDDADRAANIKVSLIRKQDDIPYVPEIAVGWNDFIGSCRFESIYLVATKELLDYNLEATFGWGSGRIHGFFGGLAWSPFRKMNNLFKGFTFAAEYDANDYKHRWQEHPDGRRVKYPINFGLHYRLWRYIHASVSSIRGRDVAASVSVNYNFGTSKGFFPKIYNPLPYSTPIDTQPLDEIRTRQEFTHQLAYAFQEQGFDLYTIILTTDENRDNAIWLKVINQRYRQEDVVRDRIEHILGALTPSDIATVTVVLESDGVCVQQYRYRTADLQRFHADAMSEYELHLLAPMSNVSSYPGYYDSDTLFHRKKSVWRFTFRPFFQTHFGSTKGKFKYATGLVAGLDGYLFDQIYYEADASWSIKSSMLDLGSCDRLNPSQIINVRTDAILYHQSNSFHVDTAFLQKSWNVGKGWFYRFAMGYFETAYGGFATEFLYYPAQANWALGFEIATVWKRRYTGMWFTQKIRKLEVFCPTFVEFNYGLQYFIDFYYDYRPLKVEAIVSIGQFLARDKGIRLELARYFDSGFRLGLWYTFTNANDVVNRKRYYDKGFVFSIPLDWFMNKSSKSRIGYAMAAWLRDIGARSATGRQLYPVLFDARHND